MKYNPKMRVIHINAIYKRDLFYRILKPIPDQLFIQIKYFIKTKKLLNLKEPRLFNEKIQWLKLNYRDELMPICADKIEVRNFVRKKINKELLNEIYGVFDTPEEIDFDILPNSFVIKLNNSSGDVIIVRDKRQINLNELKSRLKKNINVKYFYHGREWVYKHIETKILIEKLLIEDDEIPQDYKFLCINGVVETIQVDYGRHEKHRRNVYDKNWNKLNVISGFPNSKGEKPKPKCLDMMVKYSEILSSEFPLARIDFYEVNNEIIFGEITFFPGNGYRVYIPHKFNEELGAKISLSNLKN